MKRQYLGLALLASLSLAACNQAPTPGQSLATTSQETPAAFRDSVDVPLALGQALTLKSLAMGGHLSAQNIDTLDRASILVEDFDGRPFYHLTLSTKGNPTDTDFWHLIETAKSREDIVTATGANTSRTLFAFQFDENFTYNLRDTLAKAGGVKRLIVPDGSVVWLQDPDGRYWDVNTKTLIAPENVAAAKVIYQQLVENNSDNELQKNWTSLLDDPAVSSVIPQISGPNTQSTQSQNNTLTIRNFLRADGTLNTQAYLKSLPATALKAENLDEMGGHTNKPGLITPQWDVNDVAQTNWLGMVNSRAGMAGSSWDGYTVMNQVSSPESNVAWILMKLDDYGNRQYARIELGVQTPAGKQWALRSAFSPATNFRYDWDVVGCMGTAYSRMWATLVQRNASLKAGMVAQGIFSNSDYSTVQVKKTMAWFANPVQADGMPSDTVEPYITQKMGGGYLEGGTLITPTGMVSGGMDVLQERLLTVAGASDLGIRFDSWTWANVLPGVAAGSSPITYWGITPSGYYTSGNFGIGTRFARDLVRRQMRNNNLPVAFLYSTGGTGGLAGHAALAGVYRVYEYAGGYSDVFLYTSPDASYKETASGPTGWINATNRWSAYGGVFTVGPQWQP